MKNVLLVLWTIGFSALLLELGTRIYFSIRVGPEVMLWGTQWHRDAVRVRYLRGQDVFEHDDARQGYSKYHPNQARTDVDSAGVPFRVSINARGFRGDEFRDGKDPETLRVLTLGGSSTFGFGNRDDETYPYLLEQLLNEQLANESCAGRSKAEVINLGIPHLNAGQLALLFASEGAHLEADVVTFYTGYNDTLGLGQSRLLTSFSKRSLFANYLRVVQQQYSAVSAAELQTEIPARARRFIDGLESLARAAARAGVELVPISQQLRTGSGDAAPGREWTYRQERQALSARLARNGSLSPLEGKFLIHAALMDALSAWADRRELGVVDVIGLLDSHRHLMTTYVHLSPLANELIAMAIVDRLAEMLDCPQLAIR